MGCGKSTSLQNAFREARSNVENTRKALRRLLIDIQQGYVSRNAVLALNTGLLRSTELAITRILMNQDLSSSDRDKVQYYGELVATFSEVLANSVDPNGAHATQSFMNYAMDVNEDNESAVSDGDEIEGSTRETPIARIVHAAAMKMNSVHQPTVNESPAALRGTVLPLRTRLQQPPPPGEIEPGDTPTQVDAPPSTTDERIAVALSDGLTFYVQSIMDNLKSFCAFLNEKLAPMDVARLVVVNVRSLLVLIITLLALINVFIPDHTNPITHDNEDDSHTARRSSNDDDDDELEKDGDDDLYIQIAVVFVAIALLAVDSLDRHWLQRKRPKNVPHAPANA